MALSKPIALPRSPAKYRFVLTPLADAMFQLLIFFMLSSNLAPYSLLTIRSGATGSPEGGESGAEEPAPAPAAPIGDVAIWNVDAGNVVVGGQQFGFDLLADLAASLNADGDASIILVVRDEANVQDLSSVLEALAAGGISNIQIAGGPS